MGEKIINVLCCMFLLHCLWGLLCLILWFEHNSVPFHIFPWNTVLRKKNECSNNVVWGKPIKGTTLMSKLKCQAFWIKPKHLPREWETLVFSIIFPIWVSTHRAIILSIRSRIYHYCSFEVQLLSLLREISYFFMFSRQSNSVWCMVLSRFHSALLGKHVCCSQKWCMNAMS